MSEYTPSELSDLLDAYARECVEDFKHLTPEELTQEHNMAYDHADHWLASEIAAAERRGAAKALRNFADAHRFPSAWVMFRRVDDSPVSVGDLLRETADRIEADDA